jgi:general secretion pathway protein B
MSYILDALRRADSERERASIPGLHTQAVPQGSADGKTAHGSRPWVWLALGVAVVLVGQGLGRWLLHDEPPTPPHAGPGSPPPPGAPLAAAETLKPAGPPPGARPAPPGEALLPEPPPLPDVPRKPPSTAAAKAKTKAAAAASAEGAAEPRIHAQNELPDDIRSSLPVLQIGGSVYSEDPSSRFLMVNGQLLHENDKPAADLVLERIELRSAVLNYKGYRYRISY